MIHPIRSLWRQRSSATGSVVRLVLIALVGLGLTILIGGEIVWALSTPPATPSRVESILRVLERNADTRTLAAEDQAMHKVIDGEPLDSAAYSILGLIAERRGEKAKAEALMIAAGSLNRRDNVADLWLLIDLAHAGRYDAAFEHADGILRRRYADGGTLHPFVISTLADPRAMTAIGRRLATKPPWRATFLDSAHHGLTQPDGDVAILSAIIQAGGEVDAKELSRALGAFVAQGRYREAYLLWLVATPEDVLSKATNLVDGDFNSVESAVPFNWSAETGRFSIVNASAYDRNQQALRVAFDDFDASGVLGEQLLVLPAGVYRLSGEALTRTPASSNRVEWVVTCATAVDIGSIRVLETRGAWKRFQMEFTVPQNCPAEWLKVRAAPGEGGGVEVWFDKLAIDRLATPA